MFSWKTSISCFSKAQHLKMSKFLWNYWTFFFCLNVAESQKTRKRGWTLRNDLSFWKLKRILKNVVKNWENFEQEKLKAFGFVETQSLYSFCFMNQSNLCEVSWTKSKLCEVLWTKANFAKFSNHSKLCICAAINNVCALFVYF